MTAWNLNVLGDPWCCPISAFKFGCGRLFANSYKSAEVQEVLLLCSCHEEKKN